MPLPAPPDSGPQAGSPPSFPGPRTRRSLSIRSTLRLILLGMALVTALAVTGVSALVTYFQGVRQVQDHLASVAAIKDAALADWGTSLLYELDLALMEESNRRNVRAILKLDAADSPQGAALRDSLERHLARTATELTGTDALCLVDAGGKIIVSSLLSSLPLPEDYTGLLAGAASLRALTVIPAPGQPHGFAVLAKKTVLDEDGSVLGYLLGITKAEAAARLLLGRAGLGRTGQTYLAGSGGLLLSAVDAPGLWPGSSKIHTGAIRGAQQAATGQGVYPGPGGGRVIGVWREMEGFSAVLIAEQDRSEAMAPVYAIIGVNMAVCLVSLVLAFFAADMLSRRLATPVSGLARAARALAAGDPGARASETGQGELSDLARSFNAMAERLSRRMAAQELLQNIARDLLSASPGQAENAARKALEAMAAFGKASSAALGRLNASAQAAPALIWQQEPGRGPGSAQDAPAVRWLASLSREDLPDAPAILDGPDAPPAQTQEAGTCRHSCLAVAPLFKQGRVWGVLCMASDAPRPWWGESELKLLTLGGEILGMALERSRAEHARLEAEERYRALFNNAANGMGQTTSSGRMLLANTALAHMLGYPSGRGLLDSVNHFGQQHWANPEERLALWRRLETQGEAMGVEATLLTVNGGRIEVALDCKAVRAPDATIERVDFTAKDITARKALEREREAHLAELAAKNAELATAQQAVASVFDSMPSFLVSLDPGGRITRLNAQALSQADATCGEPRGRPFAQVFPHLSACAQDAQQAMAAHQPVVHSLLRLRVQGRMRCVNSVAFPLGEGPAGAVLRLDDVTERVQIEEMMIQNEKMLSVGGLAAGMAHEINNPLAGILQNVQNALRRFSRELPANQEAARAAGVDLEAIWAYLEHRGITQFLENIKQSGERAAQIVNNMLEFSRKSGSALVPKDLAVVLEKALELAASDYNLTKKFDFKRIKLVRDYAPDMPPVPCSASQIQQVALNLLSNAAQAFQDFNPPQPPRITLRLRREPGFARIEIEDNGPGMDEETRRRAFEPFFTTKDVGQGTGLGLSVCYFIITRTHRGLIAADPAPEGGTLFTIRLPLAEASIPEAPAAAPPGETGA